MPLLIRIFIHFFFILVIIINVRMCRSLSQCPSLFIIPISIASHRSISPSFLIFMFILFEVSFRFLLVFSFFFSAFSLCFVFVQFNAILTTLKSPEKAQAVSYMQLSKWNGSFETHIFNFDVRAKTLLFDYRSILKYSIFFSRKSFISLNYLIVHFYNNCKFYFVFFSQSFN